MKKYIMAVVCLVLSACQSISHKDFVMETTNSNKLPALEAVIDTSNLGNVFSQGGYTGTGTNFGTTMNHNSWIQTSMYNGSGYNDLRVQDTITLFDNFIKDDITNPYGEKKGYAVLKLGYRNNIFNYSNLATIIVSAGTLFTANILGFPLGSKQEELQLTVEILNRNKEMIGRYTATVEDKEYIAFYWGYDGTINDNVVSPNLSHTANRKITIENVKKGLYNIGLQINKDYGQLINKLK